jgi:pimeloyl-ACP methyl ester carboxylesterase
VRGAKRPHPVCDRVLLRGGGTRLRVGAHRITVSWSRSLARSVPTTGRTPLVVGACLAAVTALLTACSSAPPDDGAKAVNVGGRQVYLTCRGPHTAGASTIVLISGYHGSSDVWTDPGALTPIKPATGPPVFEALAGSHHVCAYDRPGTLRDGKDAPLTDRSSPVPQPRTARDLVDELAATLNAAHVPRPYVLVGHSLGGLVAQLYARVHPDQVKGIVFVDAFSPTIPALFGARWPIYRDAVLNPPPAAQPWASMRSRASEQIDFDASVAQTLNAPPLPAIPLAVLTKTAPFAGVTSVPGLSAAELNRLYEQAEGALVALAPATPHMLATGSDHTIQLSQPDLVVSATELVLDR